MYNVVSLEWFKFNFYVILSPQLSPAGVTEMVAAPSLRHSFTPLLPISTHVYFFAQRQAAVLSDVRHVRDWWSSSISFSFNFPLEYCCHQI